jgi:hypothetical protein
MNVSPPRGKNALCSTLKGRTASVTLLQECSQRHKFKILNFTYNQRSCIQYSDSLRAGRSGVRIPVRARLSVPVQSALEVPYPQLPAQFVPGLSWEWSGRGVVLNTHPFPARRLRMGSSNTSASPPCQHWHVMGWPLPLPAYIGLLKTLLTLLHYYHYNDYSLNNFLVPR